MKLSPTVPLALALAAGLAGAAVAQNSATSGTASTSPQTNAGYAQPQQNPTQAQPGASQMQPIRQRCFEASALCRSANAIAARTAPAKYSTML